MNKKQLASVKAHLDGALKHYNQTSFIEKDPISIPHRFTQKQDIEIAGFFAAIFAWGNRTTIINKCNELMLLMDNAPYQFITQHQEKELKKILSFKHRTFNATDVLHFIRVLRHHYTEGYLKLGKTEPSLESAFTIGMKKKDLTIETGLINLHHYFFSLDDSPARSKKHLSTPENNSSCKRLNMFLRWMVRRDEGGVDFGIWKNIQTNQLVCPLDVHVQRVAFQLGLIQEQKADWKTAIELTENLKRLDPDDPVKYDLALFSMGAEG
jgi:uncharacterized protein (TIGR02757 family)